MPPIDPKNRPPPTGHEKLLDDTLAAMGPSPTRDAASSPGNPVREQLLIVAAMIERAAQNPGPMSAKAKAHQDKLDAEAAATTAKQPK
jgi:hypothetical protein